MKFSIFKGIILLLLSILLISACQQKQSIERPDIKMPKPVTIISKFSGDIKGFGDCSGWLAKTAKGNLELVLTDCEKPLSDEPCIAPPENIKVDDKALLKGETYFSASMSEFEEAAFPYITISNTGDLGTIDEKESVKIITICDTNTNYFVKK